MRCGEIRGNARKSNEIRSNKAKKGNAMEHDGNAMKCKDMRGNARKCKGKAPKCNEMQENVRKRAGMQ